MEIAAHAEQPSQVITQVEEMSLSDCDKEQLKILLEEYKTLRTEMLQRHSVIMQLVSIVITGLGAAITFAFVHNAAAAATATSVTLVFAVGAGLLWLDNDLRLLSSRIQQIEKKVNNLAHDELMVWETTRGVTQLGYWKRIKQTFR
jgi:hypothetical protein